MGFSRQEYWSGLPFPSPGDLPGPGIEPTSPTLTGRFFTTEPPGKPHIFAAAALLQSCPTLCDPIAGSPPGCSVPGILQARIPEWVAISFPNIFRMVQLLSWWMPLHLDTEALSFSLVYQPLFPEKDWDPLIHTDWETLLRYCFQGNLP